VLVRVRDGAPEVLSRRTAPISVMPPGSTERIVLTAGP